MESPSVPVCQGPGSWVLDTSRTCKAQSGKLQEVRASRAELDFSSCVTWASHLNSQSACSPRTYRSPLAKSLTNAFPSLHSVGISGVWGLPTTQIWTLVTAAGALAQDTGRMGRISFTSGPNPCILSNSPKALGLLQLDCNSLCKSRSCQSQLRLQREADLRSSGFLCRKPLKSRAQQAGGLEELTLEIASNPRA